MRNYIHTRVQHKIENIIVDNIILEMGKRHHYCLCINSEWGQAILELKISL